MRKNVLFLAIFLILFLSAGTILFMRYQDSKNISSEDALSVILNEIPAFSHEGKPVIKINSIANFNNKWYIISISSLSEQSSTVPIKLILTATADDKKLQLIAEPNIYYSDSQVSSLGLPQKVVKGLLES